MSSTYPGSSFEAEAVRLHERYQREVVERFGLCPWAKQAHAAGRTRIHVWFGLTGTHPTVDDLVTAMRAWRLDDDIDVGFLILPTFTRGLEELERWSEALRMKSGDRFYAAAFHPRAPPDAGPVRFFRQTPDPTIQLVRRARLEEVRAEDPAHYQDIFALTARDLRSPRPRRTVATTVLEHNTAVLARVGRARIQAIFDDIQADRDRGYDAGPSVACGE